MFKTFILPLFLLGCPAAPTTDTNTNDGPWYTTAPETDFSYLPLGEVSYTVERESWEHSKGLVEVDLYRAETDNSPVAVFLPGAFVVSERYAWVGHALASHGVTVAIVQPPEDFARSYATNGTLDWLPSIGVNVDKVLLMGHSAGALTQAGLSDVSACAPGFCDAEANTPAGLAGLALFGFHNESGDNPPMMAAAEVPWLLIGGAQDGLATEDQVSATYDRLYDRPVTWLNVEGMNHYQFTGYVDPEEDALLQKDRTPEISNESARATVATYLIRFADSILLEGDAWESGLGAENDPAVAVNSKDAVHPPHNEAGLSRVMSEPIGLQGLDGNEDLVDVSAVTSFQGESWMIVRNEIEGASVWSFVDQPNLERSDWGNPHLNARFGALTEFQGELFVGLTSGLQGSGHGSTGAELWATDGENWRPVMGPTVDEDTLINLESCELQPDGSAQLLVDTDLDGHDLDGAFLDTNDHEQALPIFLDIQEQDGPNLTVTIDAIALKSEDVPCEDLLSAGPLALRSGIDEAGFGLPWNKAIIRMTVHQGRLYVATGLNYVHGPELWMSEDGTSFSRVLGGEVWGQGEDGLPLTTSITSLLSWENQLLVGTTGRSGYGARLLSLDASHQLTWLIDDSVDSNETGLDEAGLGTEAQQVADLAFFQGKIWMTTLNRSGFEVFTTTDPAQGWDTFVGADGDFPAGFGEEDQIGAQLWVVGEDLWMGTTAYALMSKVLNDMSALAWRTRDGETWQLVSAHAFGFNAPSLNRVFEQDGQLYGAAGFGGLANKTSFGPLRLYSLTESTP